MPMPLWWGKINKWVFNPMELKRGVRPVLRHIGRRSGNEYRTPLDAHPVDGGYLFILVYGSRSDWVRNVLVAGSAVLEVDGREVSLAEPRVIDHDEAWRMLPATVKPPPRSLRISEYMYMATTR